LKVGELATLNQANSIDQFSSPSKGNAFMKLEDKERLRILSEASSSEKEKEDFPNPPATPQDVYLSSFLLPSFVALTYWSLSSQNLFPAFSARFRQKEYM